MNVCCKEVSPLLPPALSKVEKISQFTAMIASITENSYSYTLTIWYYKIKKVLSSAVK